MDNRLPLRPSTECCHRRSFFRKCTSGQRGTPGLCFGTLVIPPFINDLPNNLNSQTRLFADDCIVYRTVRNQEDCMALQQDLHKLAQWENNWDMEFHPQKCSVLRVSRARSHVQHPYKLKGHILEVQERTKYLGVDLQSSMSCKTILTESPRRQIAPLAFYDAT